MVKRGDRRKETKAENRKVLQTDAYPTLYIITLNGNGLTISIKRQILRMDFKKPSPNYMLSTRNPL